MRSICCADSEGCCSNNPPVIIPFDTVAIEISLLDHVTALLLAVAGDTVTAIVDDSRDPRLIVSRTILTLVTLKGMQL